MLCFRICRIVCCYATSDGLRREKQTKRYARKVRYVVDEPCIGPSCLVTVRPSRLADLQFRSDRTFVLLFRNHETLTFVRSAGPETAVRHGDTTAGRKLADAATTKTVAAGCGDDAMTGKSARATRRARIFKGLDLA
jgi:hypothetical protein